MEWNAQLRGAFDRAATSVHRLAETAELQQLGEHLAASAQNLAAQGEAALSKVSDVVAGSNGVMAAAGVRSSGAPEDARAETGEDLAQRFQREARALESPASTASEAAATLRSWEAHLCNSEAAGGQRAALGALLRSRALHIAPAAFVRSKSGRATMRAAASDVEADTASAGWVDAAKEAGRSLQAVFLHASGAPRPLLLQLFALLAEAAEEHATARRFASASDAAGASQDLDWALELLVALLPTPDEVVLRATKMLREAVGSALDAAATVEAPDCSRDAGAAAATPTASMPALAVGTEVWAAWPGNGRWYRAKIAADNRNDGRVEVAWLRRGAMMEGHADEYLASTGCDELQFTTLEPSAVSTRSGDGERPIAAEDAVEARWRGQLESAEERSVRVRKLRGASRALAAASLPAEQKGRSAAAAGELTGLAERLAALRQDGEQQAETMVNTAAKCADAEKSFEEQLSVSSAGFEAELQAMQVEQDALQTRLAELEKERRELMARLEAVQEREQRVRASAARVSGQLRQELSSGEAASRKAAERRRLLVEAGANSRDVEAFLAARAEEVAVLVTAQERLETQGPAVEAACLVAERARARFLEELLAGWHAAVWGPGGDGLARDPGRLAALRLLHGRAGAVVEHAWRETVQLAAETLGGGESSEEMSRSAARYREMRKELQANLDRLAKLEAASVPSQPPVVAQPPAAAQPSASPQQPACSPTSVPTQVAGVTASRSSHTAASTPVPALAAVPVSGDAPRPVPGPVLSEPTGQAAGEEDEAE